MTDMTLYEAIHTQRAIRHFKPDPVDDELIDQLIEAATRAPNGGNRQTWRFVVVRDREAKARMGELYDELGQIRPGGAPDRTPWGDVPVLIVVCSYAPPGEHVQGPLASAASILPAVQNLLLTARSLGLGTVLTTRWHDHDAEFRQILGLPDSAQMHVIVPVGWPLDRFGRTTRQPVSEVTFRERWDNPWRLGA
jgi:nitroreductase